MPKTVLIPLRGFSDPTTGAYFRPTARVRPRQAPAQAPAGVVWWVGVAAWPVLSPASCLSRPSTGAYQRLRVVPPPPRPPLEYPGVVKQDKSSRGSVDTTKTRSGPQRVRMSSGERPVGAAKGKQSDTEALCQPPPPLLYEPRPCPSYSRRRDRHNCVRNLITYEM